MRERTPSTKVGPWAGVRWAPGSDRPPSLLVLLVLLLLLAAIAAGPLAGATVSGYREEIRLARDGSAAVTLAVDLSGTPGETVRLPFGHPKADLATLVVRGALAPRVEAVSEDLRVLVLTLPPEPAPIEVRVNVPRFVDFAKTEAFGNRVFAHELVNATLLTCGRYEGTFLVPEGFRVNTVVETAPADSESSATRPYGVVRVDGLDGLRLTSAPFNPAGRVAAMFRFKPATRSRLFLAALLAVGVLYLVAFRDLVGGAR